MPATFALGNRVWPQRVVGAEPRYGSRFGALPVEKQRQPGQAERGAVVAPGAFVVDRGKQASSNGMIRSLMCSARLIVVSSSGSSASSSATRQRRHISSVGMTMETTPPSPVRNVPTGLNLSMP